MRKFITAVSLSFLLFSIGHAQFAIGVKGGLTMARMNLDLQYNLSADYNFGGHAAVFAKIGKGLLSFQPEVMFIQKGTTVNNQQNSDYAKGVFNYIDVPLLARATIGIKLVEIYFNIGGYGG